MKKLHLLILFILLFGLSLKNTYCRTHPHNSLLVKETMHLQDFNIHWDYLSIFNSTDLKWLNKNFKSYNELNTSIIIDHNKNNGSSLSLWTYNSYRDSYYFYYNPVLRMNSNIPQNNYVDTNKYIATWETPTNNISGIGFKNDWVSIQIARDSENWGAGNFYNLGLNSNGTSYEYISLGSDYGNVRVRYLHGFLESDSVNVNRYLTARGLEWSNKYSFIFGISETTIYSGKNRNMEFAYFNPISSHLEIENNNRSSVLGSASANSVWQIHLDMIFKERFRVSLNQLFDEFALDKSDANGGHRKAFSTRISYVIRNSDQKRYNLYLKYVKIDPLTFRHAIGKNNFVINNYPLGWQGGSNSNEFEVGLKLGKPKIISNFFFSVYRSGRNNILYNPYLSAPEIMQDDNRGNNIKYNKLGIDLNIRFRRDLIFDLYFELNPEHNSGRKFKLKTKVAYLF